MKKMLAILLSVGMLFTLAAGCSGGSGNESKKEGDTFTVGFDASFPPYGYQDDSGEYVGFDLDLAQEVCERRGWILKKQPIDWDGKDFELTNGNVDCLWNGFTINDREDDYTWSEPYVDNSQVIVVKKDSGIANFDGLKNKTVVVQADSSALKALQSDAHKELTATFKELTQVPEYNTAFLNLESGAADAVAMDIGVAKYQIKSRGADKFVILEDILQSEKYGIGFKKGNTKLRDQVQETLDDMVKDGTFMELAKKYEDYNLPDSVCLGK